ncbi:uncharacterized protein IL334_006452 [Kwoniella shivajii]|uniref:Uncharacterized protein n=1 Tax=Kwoniella shivajii TaxID=564305 RepID=A0ABZ1D6K6_9TREE|nr:hypothetical protein IL334_006452 [Kwoniella shivajii]
MSDYVQLRTSGSDADPPATTSTDTSSTIALTEEQKAACQRVHSYYRTTSDERWVYVTLGSLICEDPRLIETALGKKNLAELGNDLYSKQEKFIGNQATFTENSNTSTVRKTDFFEVRTLVDSLVHAYVERE